MKIETMDRAAVNRLGAELRETLKKFAEERGLEFKPASGRYTANSFATRLEFFVAGGVGRMSDEYAAAYGYNVKTGDKVQMGAGLSTVVEITNRGKVIIERGGKRYVVRNPELLKPVGGAVPETAKAAV